MARASAEMGLSPCLFGNFLKIYVSRIVLFDSLGGDVGGVLGISVYGVRGGEFAGDFFESDGFTTGHADSCLGVGKAWGAGELSDGRGKSDRGGECGWTVDVAVACDACGWAI